MVTTSKRERNNLGVEDFRASEKIERYVLGLPQQNYSIKRRNPEFAIVMNELEDSEIILIKASPNFNISGSSYYLENISPTAKKEIEQLKPDISLKGNQDITKNQLAYYKYAKPQEVYNPELDLLVPIDPINANLWNKINRDGVGTYKQKKKNSLMTNN